MIVDDIFGMLSASGCAVTGNDVRTKTAITLDRLEHPRPG